VIDLHAHSRFSDGSDSPERLCELAAEAGLSAFALTDHDTLGGIESGTVRAAELGVRLVPGCEVSCSWSPGTLHVLCYFVEPGEGPLQDELVRLAADRARRNELMAERLAQFGLPITYDEVLAEAGGKGVGRPHFAAVLVRNGAAASIQDAFDNLLGKGSPGYVSKTRVTAGEIVATATASGAVAVLAHPLSLGVTGAALESAVTELAEAGLAGMECIYGRYDAETRAGLEKLAAGAGLVTTGGSDYHGSYKPDLHLGTGTGDLDVPDDLLDVLESRRPGR
jgi:predicted metal-dependent phosphoesterase TrpH